MPKTLAATTIEPTRFSIGQPIRAADLLTVSQMVNYVYGNRRQTHMALTCAPANWGPAGTNPGTLFFVAEAAAANVIDTDIWVNADAVLTTITFGAECVTGAANTQVLVCTLTGNVGSQNVTLTFTNANNGAELTGTIDLTLVSNTREFIHCVISQQRTVGAATTNYISTIRLEENTVASSLPDPDNN